ncbi:MAG: hypothetical protein ACREIC_31585 [Limisphaerales bacterium]
MTLSSTHSYAQYSHDPAVIEHRTWQYKSADEADEDYQSREDGANASAQILVVVHEHWLAQGFAVT